MVDSYSVLAPVILVRLGVYPGPVPYDGYYGPSPMSFCNPNKKDTPNIETRPSHIYNRFSTPRGSFKVFLKQHNGWEENDFDDNNEDSSVASMHHFEKGSSQRKPMRENDWEVYHRKNEPKDISKSVIEENSPSQPLCNQQGQFSVAPVNLPESKANVVDEWLLKKPEPMANPSEGIQNNSVIKKDVAWIDKIEGLNTKARIYDRFIRSVVFKEESNVSGAFNSLHKGSTDGSIVDGGYEPIAVGRVMPKVDATQASLDSIVGKRTQFQMRGQALPGRADYRGRGKFSGQENEQWRKKPAGTSTSVMSSKTNVDAQLSMYAQDHCNFKKVSKEDESNPPDKAGAELHVTSFVDATNYKVRCAKVKELATQRAR